MHVKDLSPGENFTMQVVLLLCQGTVIALSMASQGCPVQIDHNVTKSGLITRNTNITMDEVMD